ncbi:hypothetical protein O181_056205 [Austropuccinia psidii MF-1]|uniref:Maf-like protein n=1 Tax=Austropuccinia psidii MF-1 TaxID=1389203 RepID=A0A9Q3HVX1_9BASI|nr:hypothetical protein [Austropuccinia psidii MF-1]
MSCSTIQSDLDDLNDLDSKISSISPSLALKIPIFNKLSNKRIILASASPRRLKILRNLGINPQVIPSNFNEDLPHHQFEDSLSPNSKSLNYVAATASEKAIEVYSKVLKQSPDQAPDLVIGADTVIQTFLPGSDQFPKILEKPTSPEDHLFMLEELFNLPHEAKIEAVSGIAIVYPILTSPGYTVKTIAETSRIWFGDVGRDTLIAYVQQGEGIDRAGGISIEGVGSQLIRRIDGDWNNILGFPAYAFLEFLKHTLKEDEDFLAD